MTATVLIIDDNGLNRTILTSNLQGAGYHVASAANGEDGLVYLRKNSVDAVLLDLVMPGLSGYDVLVKIKKTRSLQHIPVIIISIMDDMDSIIQCIELGAADYLPKPFNPVLLKARLESSLATKHLFDAQKAHNRTLAVQNKELDAFAQTVAHDLKNPLTSIMGHSDLLITHFAKMDQEKQLDLLEKIRANSRRMSNIIQEILFLASVRKEEIKTSPVLMAPLIKEVLSRMENLIEQYKPQIIMPEDWPVAQSYGPWVEEIWANYFSNALKYGGRPPIVEFGATAQIDGTIRYWVKDNGDGISAENQAKLFNPFTQLKERNEEGQGLGLSIIQHIVTKLDGDIGVESTPGNGSTFWFTLPAAKA